MPIRLSTTIKWGLTLWLVGEIGAFGLVVHFIGLSGAILVGLLTSLLGLSLMRRAGASAILGMRAAAEGHGSKVMRGGTVLDGTLATIGAVGLLLPGFLSDGLGLILAVPALRQRIAALVGKWISGRGAKSQPGTIDLGPSEWRTDPPPQPLNRH